MVELTLGIWSTYIFENSGSISGLLSVLYHLISSLWLCRKLSYIRKTLDFFQKICKTFLNTLQARELSVHLVQ